MYVNERNVKGFDEIVDEIKLSGSSGCGITGGDPLVVFDRTVELIQLLKKEFGNHFHIHLYTSLNLVDDEKIKKLEEAGLDEIRFHVDVTDESLWETVKIETTMVKGVEVPVIPNTDLKKLLTYVKDHVVFVNINELEYADAEHNTLDQEGFEVKGDLSYAIEGSEELALEMLEEFPNENIHYCTAKLKNNVQFMNRIAERAKQVKLPFDIVNGATVTRGAIYGDGVLNEVFDFVTVKDEKKKRVLCSKADAKKFVVMLKKKGFRVEIVTELATYDQFELESDVL